MNKKSKKTEIVVTRLDKNYDDKLNELTIKNKRNKADMVRVIIEKYLDMLGDAV